MNAIAGQNANTGTRSIAHAPPGRRAARGSSTPESRTGDVRYLKNGAAKAIRTVRADRPDARPTDRVVGLFPLQIQRRFTAAARARRHRGARDGAQWPGRARVRTDGARRVHHGSHAGRQLENRP